MRAGELNRKVEIQHVAHAKDENGDVVATWSKFADVWARKVDLAGRELEAAMAKDVETSVKFIIRYRNDIKPGMRILLAGDYYRVIAPLDKLGNRDQLQIYCATGVLDVVDVE